MLHIVIFIILSSSVVAEENRVVVMLGERETLLKSGSLGMTFFPDEAIAVLQTKPSMRLLLSAGKSSYLVEGKDLKHLSFAKEVLVEGDQGEFDNGYAGISGVYAYKNKSGANALYAFYHAEDQEGMPSLNAGIPGFYASIGSAVSKDNGKTWKKSGQIITSHYPKSYTAYPDQGDKGVGTPSFVVSKNGSYLYAYYNEHSYINNRGVQICLARSPINAGPPVPGTWSKYYNGDFQEPGIGGDETPVFSAKNIGKNSDGNAFQAHVVFSEKLNLYVMIVNLHFWKEYDKEHHRDLSGMYIAFSQDGIKWSSPSKIIDDNSVAYYGESLSWQGSIIFDDGSTNSGWLVYGYSPKFGWDIFHTPHYMAGRRIKILAENGVHSDEPPSISVQSLDK